MPRQEDELLYSNAVKWINEDPGDTRIPDRVKQDFLHFNTLLPKDKGALLTALYTALKTTGLPEEIKQSLPYLTFALNELRHELIEITGKDFLSESDMRSLGSVSKDMHSLFRLPKQLLDKFLKRVAYGEQDKVEALFTKAYPLGPEIPPEIYQGNERKRQEALLYRGRLTDYSGRTFDCSAYEYAYWAKDTHMCRMLERYMDDATKELMLARINEIERIDETTGKPIGLKYQQNGAEHRSAHFDLTPLITALQEYVNGYDEWFTARNWAAMKAAWMKVGMAQRDVPAHVAQEYCRPDRSFFPLPSFNVDREDIPREALPRVLALYNWNNEYNEENDLWFPLGRADSGLGFDFAVIRRGDERAGLARRVVTAWLGFDLAAITRLDEVRTVDLTLSRDHLKPAAEPMVLSM